MGTSESQVDTTEEKEDQVVSTEEEEEEEEVEPVWEIGARRKVRVSQFKGKLYVNIREYYIDKATGEEKPGNKGIALPIDQWDSLVKLVPKVNRSIKKMK